MKVVYLFVLLFSLIVYAHSKSPDSNINVVSPLTGFQTNNITSKCVLCGIFVNEVEALLAENMTEEAIERALIDDVCTITAWILRAECEKLVSRIPEIISRIEDTNSVSKICVEDGFCDKPFTPHSDPAPVPTYIINLDALPSQRWKAVCTNKAYKEELQIIVEGFTGFFGELSPEISLLGKTVNTLYFPVEQGLEIRACADDLDVDYGWLTILNMLYEIVGACTSVVAQTVDGKILHARNMDFWDGIWLSAHLKNVTFTAEYHSLGKLKYVSTNFVGYMGIFSGMKPKAFSISIDTRRVGFTDITEYVKRLISDITHRNASLVTFLSRKVLDEATDYDHAVALLNSSPIAGEVYYIVGGVKDTQGVVLSRNPVNSSDVWRLDPAHNRWFEVETNYDHWKQPPWFDDRVVPANRALMELGRQNLTLNALLKNVLSVKPVLNLQTTFTMLTSAATGEYTTYTRYCPYPCAE